MTADEEYLRPNYQSSIEWLSYPDIIRISQCPGQTMVESLVHSQDPGEEWLCGKSFMD
jgi:hypothetical protein